MLTTPDFLATVLPTTGRYCVAGIKNGQIKQKFVATLEEIEHAARGFTDRGADAYFATASFKTDKRNGASAMALRSFFIDIDCGEGKDYPDQAAGAQALLAFVKATGLPKPMVVNSGRGLHVYWPLVEDLDPGEWGRMALRLKELCAEHGFDVDTSVTADKARVLRVPGQLNFKDDPPRPVKVLRAVEAMDVAVFREILKPAYDPFAGLDTTLLTNAARRAGDPTTQRLMGNFTASFRTILKRSAEGTGCAQVLNAFNNQATLEEPLWRAVLSIANVCSDKAKAVHIMSRNHPDYVPEVALAKAEATKGPYTCATFKGLNPEACKGCPHNITSPIALGREFIEPGNDAVVVDAEGAPVDGDAPAPDVPVYAVPSYPAPFMRGQHGGIYIKSKGDDGEPAVELVYPYDMYVVKRIADPDTGEMILVRLHLPKDGVREFLLPLSIVLARDKLRDALGAQGVTAIGKRQELLMVYLTRWVEELQTKEQAQQARKQFGWTDESFTSFVVGDREIFGDRVGYSPPSNATLPLIARYGTRGSLDVWSKVASYYALPGLEPKAFTLFLAFGNMLMSMTHISGYWMNLYSPDSGAGKTTALKTAAAIFCDPDNTLMKVNDTSNMFWNRVGVHNHLPVFMDEVTNMEPERMSRDTYGISEGRGKGRLQAHSNVERHNHSHWCTGVTSSSNDSIRGKLTKHRLMPDGELMRIMEFYVPKDEAMGANEADAFFGQLSSNYGHAIVPFIQHVINNLGEVKRRLEVIRTALADDVNMTGPERFWITMGALAMTGGEIINKLGLVDIPTEPVREYFITHLLHTREANQRLRTDAEDFLGDFLRRRVREMLIINGAPDQRTGLEVAAMQEPMNGLSIRFEPDTKMLYVSVKEYKFECTKQQYPFETSLAKYKKAGALHGTIRKRIAAGSKFNTGTSVPVLVFDTSKLAEFDAQALSDEAAKSNDSNTVAHA